MAQRPDIFTLNESHYLAKGLVFAGLGAHAGSTRYHDSSLYGNTGTLTNMEPVTDWVPAQYLSRQCLETDGSNESVSIPSIGYNSAAMTCAMWCNFLQNPDTDMVIESTANLNTNTGAWDILAVADTVSFYAKPDATYAGGDATRPANNTWAHLCIQCIIGSPVQGFINGVVQSLSGTYAANNVTAIKNDVAYVAARAGASLFAKIRTADVCIWNRRVTEREIKQLADPSNVMLSGLIQYPRRKWWPVVSGAAPTFKAAWATKRRQTIGGGVI